MEAMLRQREDGVGVLRGTASAATEVTVEGCTS